MSEIVFFHENRSVNLGLKVKDEPKHVTVALRDGRELSISKARIIATVNCNVAWNSDLDSILAKSQDLDLEELWEVVSGISDRISFKDMSDLIFAKGSDADMLSLVYSVCKDRIYFEIHDNIVVPRSRDQVLQRKIQAAKEQAELDRAAKCASWLDSDSPQTDEIASEDLGKMIRFAFDDTFKDPLLDRIKTLLNIKTDTLRSRVIRSLKNKGIISDLTNIPLLKAGVSEEGVLLECVESNLSHTEDLQTHVFSVDSDETQDIDDAISFSKAGDEIMVKIYITDIASQINFSDKLIKTLSTKPTSVYMPDQTLHMLDKSLAEDRFSLVSDQVKPTVAVTVKFDSDHRLKTWSVSFERVLISRNINYEEFNSLLDSDLQDLKTLVQSLKARRLKDGAVEILRDEVSVYVDHALQKISVKRYPKTPAHETIEELMILANSIIAKYLVQNETSCVFRTQQIIDKKILEQALEIQNPYVRNYRLRNALGKSEFSQEPACHASLGLPFYTQATSPIRRFFDIVTQFQLFRTFTGAKPLSKEQIKNIITTTVPHLESLHSVQKESKRFYVLKYLLQENINELDGVVVNTLPNGFVCEVPDFDMFCFARSTKNINLGAQVKLRIDGIQPEKLSIFTSVV